MKPWPRVALLVAILGTGLTPLASVGEETAQEDAPELAEELKEDEAGRNDEDDKAMEEEIEEYETREQLISTLIGGFVPYQPTYILPYTYADSPNRNPTSPRLGTAQYDTRLQSEEAKYQISFRVPLLTGLLDNSTTLWFGYTQRSFWQVYDTEESAPFRETNYEPEIFLRHRLGWDLGPGELTAVSLGLNHQSNGQSEPRSRSWNRIKGSIGYSYKRWLFMVNPWYRLPEDESEDDNADIEKYLGHAEYIAVYKWNDDHSLSARLMNNLRSDDNHTSVELGYSFPIGESLKGYVQYYNGYGESLIDYNERMHRIGIGIMLNDWL